MQAFKPHEILLIPLQRRKVWNRAANIDAVLMFRRARIKNCSSGGRQKAVKHDFVQSHRDLRRKEHLEAGDQPLGHLVRQLCVPESDHPLSQTFIRIVNSA
eukprot:6212531-Pleurochrysis_carterae.AAC.3